MLYLSSFVIETVRVNACCIKLLIIFLRFIEFFHQGVMPTLIHEFTFDHCVVTLELLLCLIVMMLLLVLIRHHLLLQLLQSHIADFIEV